MNLVKVLLHTEHLGHTVVGLGQFQFPVHQFAVHFHPILVGERVVYLHPDAPELRAVRAGGVLRHDFLLVDVLLQREQYLAGVDWLGQVVGYLVADGHVHDVFLLAFRNHHHGHVRVKFFHMCQCLQPAQAGHIFVQKDDVERVLPHHVNGILAVRGRLHVIPFFFQKQDVRAEQVHLVVRPKYFVLSHVTPDCSRR